MTLAHIMNRLNTQSNLNQLEPGTVLRIRRGLYDHVVLLSEHTWGQERRVLSFGPNPNGLVEMPLSEVSGKSEVWVDGYLGALAPYEVLTRARFIGAQRRYSWLGFNCEHFVRAAHDIALESPQLVGAFSVLAVMLLAHSARA